MPDDAGIARTASGAAAAAWEGRALSLDRPRRTQLPCWIAAIGLHAVAAALVVLCNPIPAPLAPAPIPVEFVTIEVADSDAPSFRAEPAVAADPSQVEPLSLVPVAAEAIEPAPAAPTAAPPPAPIVDPPRPRPREIVQRSRQRPPSAPAVAETGADVPLSTMQEPAQAIARPPPPATAAPGRESDYIGKLLGWLERFKDYPRAARLRRIEGQVMLELSIMADGQIASAMVVTGSGHAALDDAALDMVRRAAPVPVPHDGPLALRVPIMFALGAR